MPGAGVLFTAACTDRHLPRFCQHHQADGMQADGTVTPVRQVRLCKQPHACKQLGPTVGLVTRSDAQEAGQTAHAWVKAARYMQDVRSRMGGLVVLALQPCLMRGDPESCKL